MNNAEFLELIRQEVALKRAELKLVSQKKGIADQTPAQIVDVRERLSRMLASTIGKVSSPNMGEVLPATGKNAYISVISKDWA